MEDRTILLDLGCWLMVVVAGAIVAACLWFDRPPGGIDYETPEYRALIEDINKNPKKYSNAR